MPLPESVRTMSRTLARDEAYSRLRDWIVAGTLQPGEILRDQDIAAALGVSRTPIREALRRLEDEGFVETALNRWTRVAPLDLTKAAETYAVVEALEILALKLAFPRLTRDDAERMSEANRTMQKTAAQRDPVAATLADESFHEAWISRANNNELVVLLKQLKTKMRRVELAYFDASSRANQSFREHREIIKALQKRSLPNMCRALEGNWRGSLDRLLALAQKQSAEMQVPSD